MSARSLFFILSCSISTLAFGATVGQLTKEGQKRIGEGKAVQQQVDSLNDATFDLVSEFKTTAKVVDGLKIYNDLLDIQVQNQRKEMAASQKAMDDVSLIERQVVPLMVSMLDSLEAFVDLDVPFLSDERTKRVAKLRGMMLRSDVSPAEKYRRVIEAYQIEGDYGRTIEAYRGSLNVGDGTREVDFLRVGRVALLYQSVGGEFTGAWDTANNQWAELSAADYKTQVAKGLRIARKQVAPDLLTLPIPAATEVAQ
ncbi:MAG: DUF3450 domain-containing protein [Arenicellales bacterium]